MVWAYTALVTGDELLRLSPIVYHATRSENLPLLVSERALLSPAELQRRRGTTQSTVLRKSKGGTIKFKIPFRDGCVYLCDHDLLHAGNIRFEDGWDMARFVALLNGLVFFWPGKGGGPIDQGLRHRERYSNEGQSFVVLRLPLEDLVQANGLPLLSACNSGAPRHHPESGKQPRGGGTFRPLDQFEVHERLVEIVFEQEANLPTSASVADSYGGPWRPLFAS